jgi:hypothetical protein
MKEIYPLGSIDEALVFSFVYYTTEMALLPSDFFFFLIQLLILILGLLIFHLGNFKR